MGFQGNVQQVGLLRGRRRYQDGPIKAQVVGKIVLTAEAELNDIASPKPIGGGPGMGDGPAFWTGTQYLHARDHRGHEMVIRSEQFCGCSGAGRSGRQRHFILGNALSNRRPRSFKLGSGHASPTPHDGQFGRVLYRAQIGEELIDLNEF